MRFTSNLMRFSRWSLSARDALHAAVMERESVSRIVSFDAGFDRLAFVTRVFG